MTNLTGKPANTSNTDDEIDLKKIFFLFLRQWHWFILFGALGLLGAYAYLKLTKPVYTVNASILVPEKSTGLDMKNLFEGTLDQNNTKLLNQIQIIRSYHLINQTLTKLNWRTSWYRKDLFIWRGIYSKEPFDVQETPGLVNPDGVKIHITPVSEDEYTVQVKGEINQEDRKVMLDFQKKGTFGRPFVNKYFNFTLLKKISNEAIGGQSYYFEFNNITNETLKYRTRLNATQTDKGSDIIECSIEGEEKLKEVEFLNELINRYIEGKMNLQNEAQRRSLEFINEQLSGISDSLNNAGTKFTEFRSKNNIIDLGAEGKLVMDNLKDIETDKAKSQMQLDYFNNLLSYLKNTSDLKKLVSPSVVGIEDVALNSMVLKLSELYDRRQLLSFSAKENNPTLVMLDKELDQTRNQLNENIRNLIDNASRNLQGQNDRQSKISVQLNKLPQKEQQMINIQRQFNLTNEIYTFLLQKRAETNISLASSIPDVQIIDIARPETAVRKGLSSSAVLLIGLFFGLILPATFLLLRVFFDDRIRTQEDVENKTSLPILANVMHSLGKSDLAVFENPRSNLAESFRDLRTNIEFMLPSGNQGKVISVHSTNPGDGKSFISTNLGTILAMNDKKVVIVGADLRKPKLHKIFNLDNLHGLSTLLVGYDKLEDVLFPTEIENLKILPSGPIPPNPAELLSKPAMKDLMDQLRQQFDYIIVDNAPVSLVTDGIIAGRLSDLNIFIIRYGVSRKHQLDLINDYSDKKKVDHLGIVVNDIKLNSLGYTYYKDYEYQAYQNTYYEDQDQVGGKRRKKRK